MLAVFSVVVMVAGTACRTRPVADLLSQLLGDFSRNNPGRDCDNAVTDNHNYCRQSLTKSGFWRNVAVTDRGHGNDRPVNASGNTGETILPTFDDINERTKNNHQG